MAALSCQVSISHVLVINFDTEQIESRISRSQMKGGGCQDNTAHSNWTTIGKYEDRKTNTMQQLDVYY